MTRARFLKCVFSSDELRGRHGFETPVDGRTSSAHSFRAVVDLIFLFLLIGVTILATLVVIVRASLQREERLNTDRAWGGFAKSRLAAHASLPPPPATFEPQTMAQRGRLPTEEPVRLLALGSDGARFTVMEAQLPGALCARLVCTTEKARTRSKRASTANGVAIGPMFDQVFRTETSPPTLATQALTPELQRRLVAFAMGQPLRFAYDRGWVSIKWPGHEQNEARLDEALRLLSLATAEFRRAYAPDPAAPVLSATG